MLSGRKSGKTEGSEIAQLSGETWETQDWESVYPKIYLCVCLCVAVTSLTGLENCQCLQVTLKNS